jgi:hypothetical protein
VGEVGRVVAVPVVILFDPVSAPLLDADLAEHAGTVRRGGDGQRCARLSRLMSWTLRPARAGRSR